MITTVLFPYWNPVMKSEGWMWDSRPPTADRVSKMIEVNRTREMKLGVLSQNKETANPEISVGEVIVKKETFTLL